ncbi:TPA: hypothetical protein OMS29_003429 [Klebsiella aerogenes]|nr:hypothetical protein [Klebsiella aerogenes]HCR0084153.1 hypothetical protein [Klebsiella aerogenes]HCR0222286.1 hypothetical protein [Klebsiella aerogenes]HCR0512041.1 hypothetical protein [Klebsiella aerogenes]
MSESRQGRLEKWHLIVQIAAQATTIVAAIAVGVWAVYSTFYVKKEQLITEYTLKELTQKTTREPHIQARIDATLKPLDTDDCLLQVKVTLSNPGNLEGKVLLDDSALTLVSVNFSGGDPVYHSPVSLMTGRYTGTLQRLVLPFVNIGAGESYELTFIHRINTPGTYLIRFLALNDTADQEKQHSVSDLPPYQYSVGADQYVVIRQKQLADKHGRNTMMPAGICRLG